MIREVQLGFAELAELDGGRFNNVFRAQLSAVANDCMDRGAADSTKRTLTVKIDIVPVIDVETGECDQVNVQLHSATKIPATRSNVARMRTTRAGLLFAPDSPDDPDQHTMDFADGESG